MAPTVAASALVGHASASLQGSSFDPTTIFQSIWTLISGFLSTVMSSLGSAFGQVFSSFAGGISTMFQSWGFALGGYGIWGPVMVVISLAVAAAVAYAMLDGIGVEEDLAKGEEEV